MAVTGRLRADDRLAFLAEAGELLSSSLDDEKTLRTLANLVVPRLADWCVVFVAVEEDLLQLVVAHTDPELARWAEQRSNGPARDAERGAPKVVRTGQPELVPVVTDDYVEALVRDPNHAEVVRTMRMRSFLCVPLEVRGKILGAISLTSTSDEIQFSQDDLEFAQELARRAALAVENARLYRESEAARAAAEAAAETLRKLEHVTDAALVHLSTGSLLEEMLRQLVALLDAETSAILLLDDDGNLRLEGSVGFGEAAGFAVPVPFGAGFAGRVAASGRQRRQVLAGRRTNRGVARAEGRLGRDLGPRRRAGSPPGRARAHLREVLSLDPNLTRGVGGTGLGLYICRCSLTTSRRRRASAPGRAAPWRRPRRPGPTLRVALRREIQVGSATGLRRGTLVRLTAFTLVLGAITFAIAYFIPWLPDQASEEREGIDLVFWLTAGISIAIFGLVSGLIVYAVLTFRRRPGDESDGAPIHGHTGLEIVWTAIPTVLVTVIAATSGIVLVQNDRPDAGYMTVDVTARQFAWSFSYADAEGVTASQLRLPVGRSVKLRLSSLDVIHSFWVPEFGQKMDAVPGQDTQLVITPTKVGDFSVICTELCGLGHAVMRTRAIVMPQAEFDTWLKAQRDGREGPPREAGRAVFDANGCAGCHVLKAAGAAGTAGPNLDDLPALAEKAGVPLEEFVRESITDPGAYVEPGFAEGAMPPYALPADQLDSLVQYLVQSSKEPA